MSCFHSGVNINILSFLTLFINFPPDDDAKKKVVCKASVWDGVIWVQQICQTEWKTYLFDINCIFL